MIDSPAGSPAALGPHGGMRERLLQIWRACCGGLGFAVFGSYALALALVVLPVGRRLHPSNADLRAQRALHRAARRYLRLVEAMRLIRVDVRGAERLQSGRARVVVANHPTLFDVILLCALMPQMDCVVKPSWARNRFLRGLVESAGYVRCQGAHRVVRECVRRLRQDRALLIFPEGSRSPRGGLGSFHRGAAHMAIASGAPLLPVLITCDPPITSKGQKWYDLSPHPVQVTIRVAEEIPPLSQPEIDVQASRDLTRELREYFVKGLDLVDVRA